MQTIYDYKTNNNLTDLKLKGCPMTTINRRRFMANSALVGSSLLLANRNTVLAAKAQNLKFILHATCFSSEMKLIKPLDP